ncbi:hypothetical protein ACFSKL_00025 [Belliella marina]|uniref:PH domain-containing protein n=1 Tax=Belliella marina TaxID=1644146 RepID=A0ABW4VK57_9BACT
MKRIKFDNLQFNWFFISTIIVSLLCVLFGFFEVIEFENTKINRRISTLGYLLMTIYFSRMFWFKNYVQWNKKGVVIRIKQFWGKSLSFKDIKSSKLEGHMLTIYKYDGITYDFDLRDIDVNDSKRLNDIINKYRR